MFKPVKRSVRRHAAIATAGLLLALVVAAIGAATADAALYKMVLCGAGNGSNDYETATNTRSPQKPEGIFNIQNVCGPAGDPAGDSAFFRINETEAGGPAGEGAFGKVTWTTAPWVSIASVSAFTRQPDQFQEGWRSRIWAEGHDGSLPHNILMQGAWVSGGGIFSGTSQGFEDHSWPFGSWGSYRRFTFEMTCMRAAGCDRSGWNTTDANTFTLILDDTAPSRVWLTSTDAPFMGGQWVKGTQTVYYMWSEAGAGIASERIWIDGAERWGIDHVASGQCNRGWSQRSGEFARVFNPCPAVDNFGRHYTFETSSLSDGQHTVQVCTQDYGQRQGLHGSGGQSCDQRTIRTDNSAPGAPSGLRIDSANPHRYLDRFGASFSLPPNSGSPIAKIHHQVINASGQVVRPTKTITATNPTSISGIDGPKTSSDLRLRLWLEDQVGHVGPAATVAIPRDTTPPAAPQDLRVAGPSGRWVEKLDLRWQNVVDAGSPIVAARYRMIDAAGEVVVPARLVAREGIEAIDDVPVPPRRDDLRVEVWVSDEEGNVGAPAALPLPRDTTPPAAPQGISVAPPGSSRAADGFDVRWRNLPDEGSPIVAAHYEVLSLGGEVVVPATTVSGAGIEAIEALHASKARGGATLRLWVSDEEGNVGAPATAPLAYSCVRSDAGDGTSLTSELGGAGGSSAVLRQGQGVGLTGRLASPAGHGVANAALCVFGRIESERDAEFLGLALTDSAGHYSFSVPAGPSRELAVAYRDGHREVTATARVWTRVKPHFTARRKTVRNKGLAHFKVQLPGPNNGDVVVVFQVERGDGWLAFRRVKTDEGGSAQAVYRFTRTDRATLYRMRAQVRTQSGYSYLAGTSRILRLVVLPARREGDRDGG